MPSPTLHLRPHAEVAERVLLPGDPGRALRLAQALLDGPRMLNHNRGLWGYTGAARADGAPLTVQSSGMGGPSAAIIVHELTILGARRIVRVGTCGSLVATLTLGRLLVAERALARDGTSRALGTVDDAQADGQLRAALRSAAPQAHAGTVASTDLFHDPDPGANARWAAEGALAVEMETATLFALAAADPHLTAASLLIVSDELAGGGRVRIEEEALLAAELEAGEVAVQALAGTG